MKELPLGSDDFKKVADGCYYVDKTGIIPFLCQKPSGRAFLFNRPRRFGKSLMLSMLECFFDMKEESTCYFMDKKVWNDQETVKAYMNKYPVIHLDMKDVFGENIESNLSKAKETIRRLYEKYGSEVLGQLEGYDRSYYERILNKEETDEGFSSSLRNLCSFLFKTYGRRAIVLIDEYDTPIRSAYENGYYQKAISFYKSLYGEALKGNDDLELAVLTGILQVARESLFSGLNNLRVYSVLSKMKEEPFGFTEKEVDALLEYYGYQDKKQEVKEWYDGYLFGEEKAYNPLSVLSYIDSGGRADPYWINTGENSQMGDLLSSFFSHGGEQRFAKLLSGEEVISASGPAISYLDLEKDPDALLGYLLSSGYLTVSSSYGDSAYALKIPNKEINAVFANEVKRRYLGYDDLKLALDIKKAFEEADGKALESLLEEYLLSGFSYFEFGNEKSYQSLLLVLSSLLFPNSIVKSEANEGVGRADIICYPKDKKGPGIVIEVKCHKSPVSLARLKDSSISGLSQIKRKGYDETLDRLGVSPILHFGVSFYKKNVRVSTSVSESKS